MIYRLNRYRNISKQTTHFTVKQRWRSSMFFDYFFKYYDQNQQIWAYCYRQNAGCNTNMNLESFHKVLKEKIMSRLKVKSVYDCLCYSETYLIMKENDVQKNKYVLNAPINWNIFVQFIRKWKSCKVNQKVWL